jgi:uncharacterized membrane protein/thiol-disulfide isomerase/thioredoxin
MIIRQRYRENTTMRATKLNPANSILLIFALIILSLPVQVGAQEDESATVKAILFFNPGCPHCAQVINEFLIPMAEEYGDQLEILAINTSYPDSQLLFGAAIDRFNIPKEKHVVPLLIVSDVILVGGAEIPNEFPRIVEEGLASGGIDWPDIPGLEKMLRSDQPAEPTHTPKPPSTDLPRSTPTATQTKQTEIFQLDEPHNNAMDELDPPPDPVGFTLAGIVLLGMVGSLGLTMPRVIRLFSTRARLMVPMGDFHLSNRFWLIPLLAILGLGISGYLAYVEIQQVEAVCGPVGECNLVQASPYAQIMGIPVALLGIVFYLGIGGVWITQRFLPPAWQKGVMISLAGLTILGTLFSIYLTLLELFVIRAVCAWCLSSAIVTTSLMILMIYPYMRKDSILNHE